MTAQQHEQVDEIFGELLERDSAMRSARLAAIDDPDVRAELQSLLAHTGGDPLDLGAHIASMMQQAGEAGVFEDRTVGPGTRFERYRIVRRIGQGGMGDVYEAERENDFQKRVALKIVRYGLDSDMARARFQQERQVLAGLEHPNIARLLDGGEAANGCPYLVLEFVDGVPINTYAEGRTRAEILELFLKVCEAVAYAHRNLLVHRDLKPGNILVTADGEPKLLDFGIAKLLDSGADVTQTVFAALTPQYASPEQVRGQPVTTASDVYSLGVILYQLLTGRRPYEMATTTTALDLERIVCETPPAPARLGDELDDILMMALRKEPERRYSSVVELAQDIERYRAGKPVLAAPDSATYRTRKYLRRHWIGIASTAVTALALIAGMSVALYQAHVARQRLTQVRELANKFLFDFHDQIADIPGTTKARAYVVKTAQQYLDDLAKNAGSDLGLQADLAQAYERLADAQAGANKANLGDAAGAEKSHRRSIALYEALMARDPKYTLQAVESWRLLGFFYTYANRPADASKALDRALALSAPLQKEQSYKALLEVGTVYGSIGAAAEQRYDYDAQVENARQALRLMQSAARLAAPGSEIATSAMLGGAHLALGRAYFARTDLPEAEAEFTQSFAYQKKAFELSPASTRSRNFYAIAAINLFTVYTVDTQPSLLTPAKGGPYAREAMTLLEPLIAADANDVSSHMNYIGSLIGSATSLVETDPSSALQQVQRAAVMLAQVSARPGMTNGQRYLGLDDQRSIVLLLTRLGAPAEALRQADSLLVARRRLLSGFPPGDDNFWFLSDDLRASAQAARSAGDTARSDAQLREALSVSAPFAAVAGQQMVPAFFAARLYHSLGDAAAAARRCAEARDWQSKEKQVWSALARSRPYAAAQLQRASDVRRCPA